MDYQAFDFEANNAYRKLFLENIRLLFILPGQNTNLLFSTYT